MESLAQDLRFSLKLLWKDKAFALTAIATLAVGLGANAAIFSVLNSVLLSPLPFPDSDRLVVMYNSYPNAGAERASNGVPDYFDRLRELGEVFEEQALYDTGGFTIGTDTSPERVQGLAVTPSFFRVLDAQALVGRTFTEEEGELGNDKKVVLSYPLWQQLFGGEEDALGKDVRISGEVYSVVGVMPEDFLFLRPDTRLWVPLAFTAEQKSDEARHNNSWENIGKLEPGATLAQVRSRLDALVAANHERFPEFKEILLNAGYNVRAELLKDELVRDVRPTLNMLGVAVLFVLLIGCANIANLLVVRSTVRQKELALRFALGARGARVSRQLITESLVLSLIAGALALALGHAGLAGLRALGLSELPRGSEIEMTAVVTGAVVILSVVIGIAMGLGAAAQLSRVKMSSTLREEGRTGTAARSTRVLRNTFVVVQVAFAFVLLVGAGLLLSSFRQVLRIDPGFRDGDAILTAQVSLPETRYPDVEDLRAFMSRLLDAVRSLPEVEAAGLTSTIPFGNNFSDSVVFARGYEMQPGESLVSPSRIEVTSGYFEAMGIPLVEGRFIDERDTADGAPTVVVDERLARKFWPNESALDKELYFPTNAQDLLAITDETVFIRVVGVVGNVTHKGLTEADTSVGTYYLPYEQRTRRRMTFAIKTPTAPHNLVGALRREIAGIDPELPLYDIATVQERMDQSLVTRRSPALLALAFGGVALFLSAVGVYGLLAYLVQQRSKEVGIRLALGSTAGEIFRLVLREGVTVVGIGLAVGLVGAIALARYVQSVLYAVEPTDPGVLTLAATLLAVVAFLACAIPAARATRIAPIEALRAD